jgi:hypothetical protein
MRQLERIDAKDAVYPQSQSNVRECFHSTV